MASDLETKYPGNSELEKKSRSAERPVRKEKVPETRKKLAPVVTNKVTQKEKSLIRRAAENFLSEDVGDVKDYVIHDVLIPSAKNMAADIIKSLCDAIQGGFETALFGRRISRPGTGIGGMIMRDRGRTYVNYNTSSSVNTSLVDRESRSARARHDFSENVYSSRAEAEDVLSNLVDLTLDFGMASVADYYELSGVDTNTVDQNYGWTNLKDAYTERVSNGYVIRLPHARPL